jgi:hypothetical protein
MQRGLDAVRVIDVPTVRDERGRFRWLRPKGASPSPSSRFYMHHMTAEGDGHAHRDTEQCILAMADSSRLELADGRHAVPHRLDNPACGLYLSPMVSLVIRDISPDAVCLILASTHYDRGRSIRTLAEYLDMVVRP